MKKLLLSIMLSTLIFAGCNSKNEETNNESDTITVEDEKETLTAESIVKKSIEKYGEAISYTQYTKLNVEDEEPSAIQLIMTIDNNENAKFEADINNQVTTVYEVNDEAFIVEEGELSETEPMNLASNATYGDIIKITENLQGGKVKQEDDQFYLTYDLNNEENKEALLENNLAESIQALDDVEGTLVFIYSKEYLLTEARVEGTGVEDGKKIDFKGTSQFKNVGAIEEIDVPK